MRHGAFILPAMDLPPLDHWARRALPWRALDDWLMARAVAAETVVVSTESTHSASWNYPYRGAWVHLGHFEPPTIASVELHVTGRRHTVERVVRALSQNHCLAGYDSARIWNGIHPLADVKLPQDEAYGPPGRSLFVRSREAAERYRLSLWWLRALTAAAALLLFPGVRLRAAALARSLF